MRWYWIDRFIEFESGRRARAVKNVSFSEEHLHDHFPGYPAMPNSLIIEGMAQTAGLLLCEHTQFLEKIVLAKVPRARFYSVARPGDTLVYTATIEYVSGDGAMITGTSHRGDKLQAEMELVMAHLNNGFRGKTLFNADGYLRMLRTLRIFEVGRTKDGDPLQIPAGLRAAVEAEQACKT